MTFSEKISLGHAAFKRGLSLAWCNKMVVFCSVVGSFLLAIFAGFLNPYLCNFLQALEPKYLFFVFVLAALAFLRLLPILIITTFLRFFFAQLRGEPQPFFACFKFNRTVGWQIVQLGLLDALVMALIFFPALLYVIFGWQLIFLNAFLFLFLFLSDILLSHITPLFIIDGVPSVWIAIQRGAALLWEFLLPFFVISFESMILFVIGNVVLSRLRVFFSEIANIMSNHDAIFLIFCVGFFFMLFYTLIVLTALAANASLYDAKKTKS